MAKVSMSNKNGVSTKTVTTSFKRGDDTYTVSTTESPRAKVPAFNLFGLIAGVLLLGSLISSLLQNGQSITFGGFLQYLSNAPSISHVFSKFELVPQIVSDAGIFGFLVPTLNACITIINVIVLLFRLVWNSLDFVFYLICFFF